MGRQLQRGEGVRYVRTPPTVNPSFGGNSKASKPVLEHHPVENEVHHRICLTPSFRIHYKVVGNRSVDRFIRRDFVRASDCAVPLEAGIFKSRYVRYTPLPPIDHSLNMET